MIPIDAKARDFCYDVYMKVDEIIAILRQHEPMLRKRGVAHAALFGSIARGEARPDSDIDVMIEIDPKAKLDVFEYAGLTSYIESLFEAPVDVVDRDALKPAVRAPAISDAIYAF